MNRNIHKREREKEEREREREKERREKNETFLMSIIVHVSQQCSSNDRHERQSCSVIPW